MCARVGEGGRARGRMSAGLDEKLPHDALGEETMNLSKSLGKWLSSAVVPVALALAAAQPGCMFGSGGPSTVAQGHAYRSGDPTFDRFFTELYELQVELAKAPDDEKAHRIALAKKLGMELDEESAPEPSTTAAAPQPAPAPSEPSAMDGLARSALGSVPGLAQAQALERQVDSARGQLESAKAQADQLGSALGRSRKEPAAAAPKPIGPRPPSASLIGRTIKKRAESLSIALALDVDEKALEANDVKTELETAPEPLQGDAQKLAEAIHDAARSELQLFVRMRKAKKNLDKLHALSVALDANVDAVFRREGMSKKSEVRKNLEDARALIELMHGRADQVSSRADELVSKLLEAASAKIDPAPAPAGTEVAEKPAAAPNAPSAPKQTQPSSRSPRAPRAPARPVADFEP